MGFINRNEPPAANEIALFLDTVSFSVPQDFLDFYTRTNGADVSSEEYYAVLWPLTEMVQLNAGYEVEVYVPGFFLFGSNGGDAAFAMERTTGRIFEMPFIDMWEGEGILIADSFDAFLELMMMENKETVKEILKSLGK
ncbi:SMI1/KNR4 family protein [Taibaiella soli]|uniref:Knr4/Smi1-like domain-containing protein n=1 Tax=Taibaiella soli TaxID=1649169 RepID=A0A2W2AM71_9BACT|nr:SMI1/KNR4 family protein [Taibaiella soli]PZF73400.1 hypothetical protein DN068_08390 [Taibaiella soli]